MCTWVMKFGGHAANDLKGFVYTYVPADPQINADVLDAVNKWPVEADKICADLALAVVMTEYNYPQNFVENGVTRFLKPAKIAAVVQQQDFFAWNARVRTQGLDLVV